MDSILVIANTVLGRKCTLIALELAVHKPRARTKSKGSIPLPPNPVLIIGVVPGPVTH
jgi:hypothetical protein